MKTSVLYHALSFFSSDEKTILYPADVEISGFFVYLRHEN